jgi:Tol biopolymer transport system component
MRSATQFITKLSTYCRSLQNQQRSPIVLCLYGLKKGIQMSVIQMIQREVRLAWLAMLTVTLMACGGGGGGAAGTAAVPTPPGGNAARTGLLVYTSITKTLGVNMASAQTRTIFTDDRSLSYVGAGVGPNGEVALAFNSSTTGSTSKLNILKPDGSLEKSVSFNYTIEGAPKFSSDGSQLAFTAGSRTAGTLNYFAQVVSRGGESLYFFRNYSRPDWMPDGRLVIANLNDGQLYLTGVSYQDPLTLIPNSLGAGLFSLNPAGTKIAFVRRASDGAPRHIYAMDLNGSGTRQVTTSDNSEETRAVFSPDGKELLVTSYGCISVSDTMGAGDIDRDLIHIIPSDAQMLNIRGLRNSGAASRLLDEAGQTRCTGGAVSWR